MNNVLSLAEVARIRCNLNPEKAFAPGTIHSELKLKNYNQVVSLFKRRVSKWYFDAAKLFKKKLPDYNFPIAIFCCVIIDVLSQFMFGEEQSSGRLYKKFCRRYLKKCIKKISPPIISCGFNKGKWREVEISDTADALYHGFRCGLIHSGRVYEYGRINERYGQDVVKIITWGNNQSKEINVHTTGLLNVLEKIFRQYIRDLNANRQPMKRNFIKKMHFEYGLKI